MRTNIGCSWVVVVLSGGEAQQNNLIDMEKVLHKIGELKTNLLVISGVSVLSYAGMFIFLVSILSFLESKKIQVQWEDDYLKLILTCLIIIVIHELSHFVAYHKLGKIDRDKIYFGFYIRWLVPFCACKIPVSVGCQRKALIAPLITTGSICIVIFCLSLSYWSVNVLCFALAISAKDILDFIKLRKFNKECIVTGHPEAFGIDQIFEKKEE